MDDRAKSTAPPSLIESLDESARDLAEGRVTDAAEVQTEMRRMLADYQAAHAAKRHDVPSPPNPRR
jgi:hypothetical protein